MFTNFPILLHPFALYTVYECFLFGIQVEQCSVREMKPFSIIYNLVPDKSRQGRKTL